MSSIGKRNLGDRTFDTLNSIFMIVLCIICLYPIIYVLTLSFNDGADAMKGGIYLLPRKFTFDNYRQIFIDSRFLNAFGVTVFRTVVATTLTILLNSCFAFALSKKNLPGAKGISWFIVFPMYFSGGIIPYYLVCRGLNLIDNIWVYILPWLVMPIYILILKACYLEIPDSLEESAMIDGAGYFIVFFKIYFPLSLPTIATIVLLSGVHHWNDWLDGTIMVSKSTLWPLQTLLLNVVQGAEVSTYLANKTGTMGGKKMSITSESLKMAMLIVTVVPIAIVYPFLQKYYIKGMMVGAVKG